MCLKYHEVGWVTNTSDIIEDMCKVEFIQSCVGFIACQICLYLALRYPIFRWKLCKGCVWENVKKTQDVCIQRSLTTGSCDWLTIGKSPKLHTCEACRELKGHDNWSTTRQNIQFGQTIRSRLNLVTCSTHKTESWECLVWMKIDFSHSSHTLL